MVGMVATLKILQNCVQNIATLRPQSTSYYQASVVIISITKQCIKRKTSRLMNNTLWKLNTMPYSMSRLQLQKGLQENPKIVTLWAVGYFKGFWVDFIGK